MLKRSLQAKQGVLDLHLNGILELMGGFFINGEWEYFPEQFESLSFKEGENKNFIHWKVNFQKPGIEFLCKF